MSNKTIEQINQELNAKIPREAVLEREGSNGRSFSYLAGHYVIDRLNSIFGPLFWASSTIENKCVHSGAVESYGKTTHTAHYIARVRLVVQVGGVATEHCGTGYGDGSDKINVGKAHELAAKEAETDALKRAAKNLGMSLGLALYDKDQENVEDEPQQKEEPKKSAAPNTANKASKGNTESGQNDRAPIKANEKVDAEVANRTLQLISATSKVIVAQGKNTVEGLKKEMREKHGAESKEQLTPGAAEAFLKHLQGVANAVTTSA